MYIYFFCWVKFLGALSEFLSDQKFSRGAPLNVLPKSVVARENAVQMLSNFPAKRLSIYTGRNFVTPLVNYLKDFKLNNLLVKSIVKRNKDLCLFY